MRSRDWKAWGLFPPPPPLVFNPSLIVDAFFQPRNWSLLVAVLWFIHLWKCFCNMEPPRTYPGSRNIVTSIQIAPCVEQKAVQLSERLIFLPWVFTNSSPFPLLPPLLHSEIFGVGPQLPIVGLQGRSWAGKRGLGWISPWFFGSIAFQSELVPTFR